MEIRKQGHISVGFIIIIFQCKDNACPSLPAQGLRRAAIINTVTGRMLFPDWALENTKGTKEANMLE